MILTHRLGAVAARPTFERIASQDDLDRELHDLLNDADLEPVTQECANQRQPLQPRGERQRARCSSF